MRVCKTYKQLAKFSILYKESSCGYKFMKDLPMLLIYPLNIYAYNSLVHSACYRTPMSAHAQHIHFFTHPLLLLLLLYTIMHIAYLP